LLEGVAPIDDAKLRYSFLDDLFTLPNENRARVFFCVVFCSFSLFSFSLKRGAGEGLSFFCFLFFLLDCVLHQKRHAVFLKTRHEFAIWVMHQGTKG